MKKLSYFSKPSQRKLLIILSSTRLHYRVKEKGQTMDLSIITFKLKDIAIVQTHIIPLIRSNTSGNNILKTSIFSVARRIKTRLHSTIATKRCNNLSILSIHKELTDSINSVDIGNEFALECDGRRMNLGKFVPSDLLRLFKILFVHMYNFRKSMEVFSVK